MAVTKGPFAGFGENRESMMQVMHLHRDAARRSTTSSRRASSRRRRSSAGIVRCSSATSTATANAQATVLAPTGTIGLLMDCDTTGVERISRWSSSRSSRAAATQDRQPVGAGSAAAAGLRRSRDRARHPLRDRHRHARRRRPTSTAARCCAPGCSKPRSKRIEQALPAMIDLRFAFGRGMLSEETLTRLGVSSIDRERATVHGTAVSRLHRSADRRGQRRDLRQPDRGRGAGAA